MTHRDMPSHHGVAASPGTKTYANDTIQLLIERASCRSFTEDKIPPDVLKLVLQAGAHAATGGNLQPTSIIQIEDPETKQWLADQCGQGFIGKAPTLFVFCIDWWRLRRWAELEVAPFSVTHSFRHFWISFQDTMICAQNICTAADALGLGSVYIGTILEFFAELRERLELPQGVFPVVLLCLGYPRHKPQERKKLEVDVIVHSERYRKLEDRELLDAFEAKYPGHVVQVTEQRLAEIAETCRQVHGPEFAAECLAKIEATGHITPIQRYFGLHYRANEMPKGNEDYVRQFQECGLDWFEEWVPASERKGEQ